MGPAPCGVRAPQQTVRVADDLYVLSGGVQDAPRGSRLMNSAISRCRPHSRALNDRCTRSNLAGCSWLSLNMPLAPVTVTRNAPTPGTNDVVCLQRRQWGLALFMCPSRVAPARSSGHSPVIPGSGIMGRCVGSGPSLVLPLITASAKGLMWIRSTIHELSSSR